VDRFVDALARQATELRFEDLPGPLVEQATQHLVDSIACALGGRACAAGTMVLDLDRERETRWPGGVLSYPNVPRLDNAAFVNSAMIRYLDYNDTYGAGHPSDALGPLFAAAGAARISGRELITATVVAYEAYNRLADASSLQERGWDQGAHVAVAAAAGLGNLLRMSYDEITNAISLAAVSCSPLRATRAGRLSPWKGAATAHAAREATFLTQLARSGMEGPASPYEGRHGVEEQVTGALEMEPFPVDGGDFAFRKTWLKFWPVEYNTQLAVWAALELRSRDPRVELKEVRIGAYDFAWRETGSEPEKWRPTSRETADHSMPYVFATAYVHGGVTLEAFAPKQFTDPAVLEVMDRVRVEVSDIPDQRWHQFPREISMVVDADVASGEPIHLDLENPRGHWSNRMSLAETAEKFRVLATPVLRADSVGVALEFWSSLSHQEDLTAGFEALCDVV
jgi:2-methylcitrate dehydratase